MNDINQGMALVTLCTAMFLSCLFLWFVTSAWVHLAQAALAALLGGYVARDMLRKSKGGVK